ncbi:MAG TPA: alpha/beta hydrolase-fold protein [Candidatus Xenobia bacterium]|jgi:predicted alpha/beta superfamily hydrolase
MRCLLWLLLVAVAAAQVPVSGPDLHGDIERTEFRSSLLPEPRTVLVYLPPGYRQSLRRYPVLYLQDGQNDFDRQTSAFGQEWGLDESAERLIRSHQMAPVIMVAVYNSADRIVEYTPVSDPKHPGGGADRYIQFLLSELKPWVDHQYRTVPDDSAIMGSSLGGLLSLYASWRHPDVFRRVGCVSPSLWWDGQWLTHAMATSPPTPPLRRIWLDIGTEEGDEPAETVADTRRMHVVLQGAGYRDEQTLFYREIPGAHHNETAWAARVPDILVHLFPPGQ